MTPWRSPRIIKGWRSGLFLALLCGILSTLLLTSFPREGHALIANGENAIDILGQFNSPSSDTTPDYVKDCPNNGESTIGFDLPQGAVIDGGHKWLFVAEGEGNRVVVFPLGSGDLISSKTPLYVLGQPDFMHCASGDTQSGLNGPLNICIDTVNQRLFVPEFYNNRVLVFSYASMSNGMNASYVLGQPNFTSQGSATSQSGFNEPSGCAYDSTSQYLYVGDANNNRVMIFNLSGGITNGMNASYVWGQSNFTAHGAATSQTGLTYPTDVGIDSTNHYAYVTDEGNNRVMVFNTSSVSTHQSAAYVLGQSSFTTSASNLTQNGFVGGPWAVTVDGTNQRLFVADTSADRILIFGTASLSNGMNASYVLGQGDFVDENNGSWTSGFGEILGGLAYDPTSQYLYVADSENNRLMVFSVPPGTPAISGISQNGADGCEIVGNNLYCQGQNGNGEAGLGNTAEYNLPTQVTAVPANWSVISEANEAGMTEYSACGIAGGALYCWGENTYGEAGLGNTTQYTTPQQVGTDTTWTAVSTSGGDACGIDAGKLYCWGYNQYGELGLGNATQYSTPQQVGSATNWIAISVSGTDTCGIRGSSGKGSLWCWGANAYGEVGNASVAKNTVFVTSTTYAANFGASAAAAITAANADCAARATAGGLSGTYYAWIANSANNPANEFTQSTLPYELLNGTVVATNWTALTSGALSNAITETELAGTLASGDVWSNVGTAGGEQSTATSKNCSNYTSASSGNNDLYGTIGAKNATWTYKSTNTVACNNSEHLYCFSQYAGASAQTTPVQIGSDTNWSAISQGSYDTCGIDNGALYCWGYNQYGELGLGNTSPYPVPTQVGALTTWTAISIAYSGVNGSGDACGIAAGALYCWGSNSWGEDGLGNTTAHNTPQQVGSATNWTAVSQGGSDACAYTSTYALYCWGYNNLGEDGQNNTTQYKSPQLVNAGGLTGESATDLLGQYTTTTSTATIDWEGSGPNNGPTALGLNQPGGIALDTVNHYLYVSDQDSDRVVVYALNHDNSFPTGSGGHTASLVLGQTTLQGAAQCVTTQSGFCDPAGLAYDPANQRLFVADAGNNRVLVFNTAGGVTNGENASYVIGQPDFVSNAGTCSATQFSWGTEDIALDVPNQRLFVANEGCNEVLVFNVSPATLVANGNGEAFSYVLGCSGTTGCPIQLTTQSGFYYVGGVSYDAADTLLYVADPTNNRVLVFNVAPGTISNGENASYVLGQTSFTASGGGTGQAALSAPNNLSFDANNKRLFVDDEDNNRVVVFNASPNSLANGENATYVLGQPNFTSGNGSLTQSTMYVQSPSYPFPVIQGLFYDPGSSRLFVSDYYNNRVLIFDGGTLGNFLPLMPD